MTPVELLHEVNTRGVTLTAARGELRVRGSERALTDALVAELREHKAEVLTALQERQADHLARITRQTMEAGAVPIWPVPWNRVLRCARCGPVYWAAEGKVEGCPWCWIRADGFAVPQATAVSSVR